MIVKLNDPLWVGRPRSSPVFESREIPRGNVPEVTANVGAGNPTALTNDANGVLIDVRVIPPRFGRVQVGALVTVIVCSGVVED